MSQPQLRVVLACDWFVRYTTGLAVGLAASGADVTLVTRDHTNEFPDRGDTAAAARYVRDVLGGQGRHRTLGGRVRDPSAFRELGRLTVSTRRFAPHVVHVQESVLDDPRLLVASTLRRRRYAVTFHDPVPHPGDPIPGFRRRHSERLLLRHAGLIFVHSNVDREELRRTFRTEAPIEIVPHGTGPSRATPLPDAPTLLFFGRIVEYKGLPVLLEALPAIWSRVPTARLVIAGAGELPAHPLLDDPRVELHHGHVPDETVPLHFERARCVVLPYIQASQSGVGSQAKIYGRPSVVTDTGGLPELVADGSGLVVAPGDAAALADALVTVLSDGGVASRLAERAVAGGLAADWPEVALRTREAYRRYLGAP